MAQTAPSRPPAPRRGVGGFSLIEVLIVVAIMGILAAIAYPAYGEYVRQTRRADGHLALLSATQRMERCRATAYSYASCTLGTNLEASPEGHYAIAIDSQSASAFTLSASAQGVQTADTDCTTMTIDHLGVQSPEACWN